jgi:hypothetical protein
MKYPEFHARLVMCDRCAPRPAGQRSTRPGRRLRVAPDQRHLWLQFPTTETAVVEKPADEDGHGHGHHHGPAPLEPAVHEVRPATTSRGVSYSHRDGLLRLRRDCSHRGRSRRVVAEVYVSRRGRRMAVTKRSGPKGSTLMTLTCELLSTLCAGSWDFLIMPTPGRGDGQVYRDVYAGMTDQVQVSTTDWVREETEQILAQGTTDGVLILDRPVRPFHGDGREVRAEAVRAADAGG